RTRLLALPGGRAANDPDQPKRPERPVPVKEPVKPRPAPKPSEVFPPRRKPAAPPAQHSMTG
ncbi:hypothetical protein G3I19_15105, partial [Streptomyces sp. SID10853]|nr:hypothetical protein [Streptomyces sp. SID10853]